MGSDDSESAAGSQHRGRAGERGDDSFVRGSDPARVDAAIKGMSVAISGVSSVLAQLQLLAGNLVSDPNNRPGREAIAALATSAGEVGKVKAGLDGYVRALTTQSALQAKVSGGATRDKPSSLSDALKGFQGLLGAVGRGAGTSPTPQPSLQQVQQLQQSSLTYAHVFTREIQRLSLNRPLIEGFVKRFGLDDNVKALVDALAPAKTAAEAMTILQRAGAELLTESVAERSGQTVDPQKLGHWGTMMMGEVALQWARNNNVDAVTIEALLKTLYEAGRGRGGSTPAPS
jgi:hypothetical protein